MYEINFDLDRSIEDAWEEFTARLTEVLSMMDDEAQLTLSTPPASDETVASLIFDAVPGMSTTRGEPAINLRVVNPSGEQSVVEQMGQLGWNINSDGKPELTVAQAEVGKLAKIAVGTLREIFGVHHPVFLSPDQLAEVLQPTVEEKTYQEDLFTEGLTLQPEDIVAVMPSSVKHLRALVAAELEEAHGHPPVSDKDGDLAVRVGSTVVFVRVSQDMNELLLFAPIVHDIEGRTRAAEVANDLNTQSRFVHYLLIGDRLFAQVSLFSKPFVPAHFHLALRLISEFADGIDNELAAKLYGRTTYR